MYRIAAPGTVTLARLTRHDGRYVMNIVPAEFVDFGDRSDEIAAISQDNWPHAFARFECSVDTFISHFHCNHIHGVYGDWVVSSSSSAPCSTSTVAFSVKAGANDHARVRHRPRLRD